jgi:NAD(P)-dependent dehydrogenase (short-subunit alcohol dehydrogenase family)
MTDSLKGKTALITGGARGIGLAVARGMIAEGTQVILADIDIDTAAQAAEALGDAASAIRLDLSDVNHCKACVAEAIERNGQLDILVNNGGICQTVPIEDIDQAFYDRMFDINVRGAFFCSQAAAVHMRERQTGRIINIASIAARTGGSEDVSVYAGTKGAMVAITKAFAKFLAPGGTCNAVLPGPTRTDLFNGWADDEMAERLAGKIPMGRLATPEDHAGAVVFLATDAAAYITGAGIDTNGGMYM